MTVTFENRKIYYLFLGSMSRIEELLNALLCLMSEKHSEPEKENKVVEFKEKWLDKQEILQLLKISERTLYNLRKAYELPVKMIGGKMYFNFIDIERLMK